MTFFRPLNFNDSYGKYEIGESVANYAPISNLSNSDIFTAINVISNDIATNPIKLEAENINHIADSKFDNLNYLLNVKPNDQMSARYFKYAMTANLLLNGNSYARIYKLNNGEVMELQLLQPSWVQPLQDDKTGEIYYEINDGLHKIYQANQDEILHVRYLTTNGLIGKSPLYALKEEVEIQQGGNRLLKDFFGSGINGSGILKLNKTNLAANSRKHIRDEWFKANGPDNKSRLIVSDASEEYQPLEVDTSILKIVNSNDYTTKQIAKVFGIPVSRLGLENSHTSLPQSNLDYVQNSLDHYFSMWTSEMNIKLLNYRQSKKFHFEFDVSRLMELDAEKNMELTIDWFKSGLLSDTEARRRVGYAPFDDKMAGARVVISNFVPMDNIQTNFPNNVIVANAYDDTGKPSDKKSMSKSVKERPDGLGGGDNNDEQGNGNTESGNQSDDQ